VPALLEARNLTKIFGGGFLSKHRTVALEDFSLTIDTEPPSVTAIVGESGSGKTTLARLLLGLTPPTTGGVYYLGRDVHRMSGAERREFRRDVQVVFQDPYDSYNPFYRIDHVLAEPITNFRLTKSASDQRALIVNALEAVGLRPEETLGRFPHQLSGGQRQRLMVARALLVKPRLIIADEPVSMVDASLRATILGSLRKLNQDFGISIVYITHDLTTAYQISKNIIVMYSGSPVEAGDVEAVVHQPKHPYTQLLISSIPLPHPHQTWNVAEVPAEAATVAAAAGCKFAARCPQVLPICRTTVPPLRRVGEHRVAACHLYPDSPELETAELGTVFVE
jgi:oligopeptide/dipeptide ABC transporter ATP-binding protein